MNSLMIPILIIVCFAIIGRYGTFIREPEMPVKTPFGKLPFFDGVIIYGIAVTLLLMMLEWGFNTGLATHNP